ncbi:response regulator transcription factor [Rubinisphaera margarita]|uniref:response regulator transcription factor n=1 Tax=Rubinisphaera margarita TaxID=2909586 RepID=UPI001EE7C6BE|nr:response regulator [Rubinisphaera margarita]MCG6156159.1 response regulator [Rubinisphaera margarita]
MTVLTSSASAAGTNPRLGQTVFIVDDNESVRLSLSYLLQSVHLNVKTFASAKEFLEYVDPHSDGCAIVDILMPEMSGTELLRELLKRKVLFPIIMLTAHADVPVAVESMRLGAFDFLQKSCSEQELMDCVLHALQESHALHTNVHNELEVRKLMAGLSPREAEVTEHVITGQTSREIAATLGISQKTVDTHRANVMKKLKVSNVAELIRKVVMVRQDSRTSDQ